MTTILKQFFSWLFCEDDKAGTVRKETSGLEGDFSALETIFQDMHLADPQRMSRETFDHLLARVTPLLSHRHY